MRWDATKMSTESIADIGSSQGEHISKYKWK